MEVYSDTESIDKIKKQLKKDQKVIDTEIKKLNDDPRDLEYGALHFKYIIDCHGEHRFDVHVEFRKILLGSLGSSGIPDAKITVTEYGYDKELKYKTSIIVTKNSFDSIYVVIFGIIMAQWNGLFSKYL